MIMLASNRRGIRLIRGALCLTLAVVLLCLLPLTATSAAAISPTGGEETARIPSLGGVIGSAGDAALPVAFTGTTAKAAVLIEAQSGEIVFRQNENARLPMASTTKIMTALVALEKMPLDTVITVTSKSVGVEGSSIYLVEGEKLTLEELLYALMLESANDAAETIAVAVAGSVEAFAELMNTKAADLGLKGTHFVNPHGLDHEEHYTTAYELARITQAALSRDDFREIVASTRKTIPLHNGEGARVLINHNRLLRSYEGCIGVKTGFTKHTGRCLVSAAEREGVTLIAVTLGDPNDWRDHTAMLDYGFSLYQSVTLCEPGDYTAPLWLISGLQEYVMVENAEGCAVTLRRDHGAIRCVVELPRFEYAPIRQGDRVGRLVFYEDDDRHTGESRELGTVSLFAAYDVGGVTYKPSLGERIRDLFA